MKGSMVMGITGLIALLMVLSTQPISAEQTSNSEIISIDGVIGIEKTTLLMNIPSDNTLPWAYVEGKIDNSVSDYPVIIQMYKDGEAHHFAQTNVGEDGSYEYKFRVQNIDGENITNIFEGDYLVKIFKVVYLFPDANSA